MMKQNNLVLLLGWIVAISSMLFVAGYMLDIKVNITQSMPLGLYKGVDKESYSKEDIVNLTVPVNSVVRNQFAKHPALDEPRYFLKVVYGVAGDMVQKYDNAFVMVGERRLDLLDRQESILKSGVIPEGFVFVGTPHENSFDSRYYGLIETSTITGVYQPLLTKQP